MEKPDQTPTKEVTRIALTPIQAHRLTVLWGAIGEAQATLRGAQEETAAQIQVILKAEGVEDTQRPWNLEVDGENVVIRRQ